jgi:hypothetical protein
VAGFYQPYDLKILSLKITKQISEDNFDSVSGAQSPEVLIIHATESSARG